MTYPAEYKTLIHGRIFDDNGEITDRFKLHLRVLKHNPEKFAIIVYETAPLLPFLTIAYYRSERMHFGMWYIYKYRYPRKLLLSGFERMESLRRELDELAERYGTKIANYYELVKVIRWEELR